MAEGGRGAAVRRSCLHTRGIRSVVIIFIGFYREIAIAIQDEVGDSNGGNV